MVGAGLRTLWTEPAVSPPPRPWWDVALVAVLVPASVVEGVVRTDVPLRGLTVAMAVVCVLAVLWRRTHPLAATVVAYAAQTVSGLVPVWLGHEQGVLDTTSCVLVVLYSLGRWGSGRATVLGTAFVLVVHVTREPFYDSSQVSMVVGAGFLVLPVVLGAAIRFQGSARVRQQEQVRMREREQLARELHDTVAHHVSGILIQAQAGQAVAAADPAGAVAVLAVIEEAAHRSLGEMRAIVGVLRDGAEAERSPVPTIDDVARLADRAAGPLPVEVVLAGDLDDVEPVVGTAVYRLVQESVTNAQRHARDASVVRVRVEGEASLVTVEVDDDGGAAAPSGTGGFGLAGMAERVTLLGGCFTAGPHPGGGWAVTAEIPRPGGRR